MSNLLYNELMGNSPINGTQNVIRAFQEFKNSFRGDPRAEVQRLLNSGQMTQDQFNQLSQMTNQFISMFK